MKSPLPSTNRSHSRPRMGSYYAGGMHGDVLERRVLEHDVRRFKTIEITKVGVP